jgi:predicted site-specific integrase-resolvase
MHPDVVGSNEATQILGLTDKSTISRYVAAGKLTPVMQLPGKRGAFIFNRADVERLRDERAAEAAEATA